VSEVVAVAFGVLHACRVFGLVRPANPVSRRVLEGNDFCFETEVEYAGGPTQLLVRKRDL
jgi:hypothetical protein